MKSGKNIYAAYFLARFEKPTRLTTSKHKNTNLRNSRIASTQVKNLQGLDLIYSHICCVVRIQGSSNLFLEARVVHELAYVMLGLEWGEDRPLVIMPQVGVVKSGYKKGAVTAPFKVYSLTKIRNC